MGSLVIEFKDIEAHQLGLVGGKALNLGMLSKIPSIKVPEGFCVTTESYQNSVEQNEDFQILVQQLAKVSVEERQKIREISREIRQLITEIEIPLDLVKAIEPYLLKFGDKQAYAIRSSATVEDLPQASFAGQQDTFLNIIGKEAILTFIRQCWASLYTERGIIYRMQNGFDHKQVHLAVILQKMVLPEVSGILFTADPVTANRTILSIDASFGLGEALVSGLVSADSYQVQDAQIRAKRIATKRIAIYGLPTGGTETKELNPQQQRTQALTDQEILKLAAVGRKIEAYFDFPQDIEWCLVKGAFYIVQSRPITTLYPIPETTDDEKHVYLSVGHQQMMTDALKPLGLSIFKLTSFGPRYQAGGRLFVDIARQLAAPDTRKMLLANIGESEPLIKDALLTLIQRDPVVEGEESGTNKKEVAKVELENDPAIVVDLIKSSQESLEIVKQTIQKYSGLDLLAFILEDIQQLKMSLFDSRVMKVINGAINASAWVNLNIEKWLGEKNVADIFSQSVPNNITSEMGLELLNLADVIRPYPAVIDYLSQTKNENFLEELPNYPGGEATKAAFNAYLVKYGMRCPGEIDITRTRWSERPMLLVPIILNNIKNFEPNAGKLKFEQGREEALKKEQEILTRLKQLPNGEQKAKDTKQMIALIRNYMGYREYPKYSIVSRYFVYKKALLKIAEDLVQAKVITESSAIYYLSFEELQEVVRNQQVDQQLIQTRKTEYKAYEKLTPPRVMTSDGEIIAGKYQREHLPAGALAGLPVSSGTIEGRARVISHMEEADFTEGDILVTPFTDPSWTPLFVSVKGLVTEVGGLMTHGAVIAREYGLPAVVGVENATKLIKDGQWIRVNGTEGYIELL